MSSRDEWMADGLCRQADGEAWYPEQGGSTVTVKRICLACPVTAECLAYALEHRERFGVWGGYSEQERRRLAKGERFAPSLNPGGTPTVLTAEQEAEAVTLLASGLTPHAVGIRMGIKPNIIRRLQNRRTKSGEAA